MLFEIHFKSIIHKTQCNTGTQNAFEVILVLAGIRVMVIKVLITDNRIVLFFFYSGMGDSRQRRGRGKHTCIPGKQEYLKTGTMYAHTQLLSMLTITIVLWVQDIKH